MVQPFSTDPISRAAEKRSIWLVWLLLILTVVLTPMAWLSPPDPTWITGIYDLRDFDDIVTYLTGSTAGTPMLPIVYRLESLARVLAIPLLSQRLGVYPLSSHSPRAPPLD
jgi:hypothetical protein